MNIPRFGAGIGIRQENIDDLLAFRPQDIACLEVAPENYMGIGGPNYRKFRELAEIYPIVAHGLSLSVGSLNPLPLDFLKDLKSFLHQHKIPWMTDHLCYSSVFGHQFHDLLPLPLSHEAIRHVVPRIRQIQDFLEIPFGIENVSYYASAGLDEMPEWEFLAEVTEKADCSVLLDVNNIYVNAVNHCFDPYDYLKAIPFGRVIHMHVAGHIQYDDFLLDTHGADVIDPVWKLLRYACERSRPGAVILERDHDIPPFRECLTEVRAVKNILTESEGGGERRAAG